VLSVALGKGQVHEIALWGDGEGSGVIVHPNQGYGLWPSVFVGEGGGGGGVLHTETDGVPFVKARFNINKESI
jgi:hypothetical protein